MKKFGTIVAVLVAVGLGSNSYGASTTVLFGENFDSMPPGTALEDLGWTEVYNTGNSTGPEVSGDIIDVGNSAGMPVHEFGLMYKKALPGGSYTLGENEYFLLSAVQEMDFSNTAHTSILIAYNAAVSPGVGCRPDLNANTDPHCFSGIQLGMSAGGGSPRVELKSSLNELFFPLTAHGLSQSDLPMKVELEIHPTETFLNYTPFGGSTITVAPKPQFQGGMSTIDEVRLYWQFKGRTDSVLLEVTPEPASLAILSLGGLLMLRRRRA